MSRTLSVFLLAVFCVLGLGADPVSPAGPPADGWNEVIADLQSVSDDLADNQKQIDDLQAKIGQLQSLGKDAASEIARLQTLVEAHAARVKELGDRYVKVLTLAQKLKHDVERASVLNWVFGGTAAVAVVVAIGEGFALSRR